MVSSVDYVDEAKACLLPGNFLHADHLVTDGGRTRANHTHRMDTSLHRYDILLLVYVFELS